METRMGMKQRHRGERTKYPGEKRGYDLYDERQRAPGIGFDDEEHFSGSGISKRHIPPRAKRKLRRPQRRSLHGKMYISPYGEHPDSLGRMEYRGSNKRHPGLGNAEVYADDFYSYELQDIEQEYRPRRRHGPMRNEARRRYREYMDRGQYELPFHPREDYDPAALAPDDGYYREDPSLEYLYHEEGAQGPGNHESFGRRGSVRHGQDWLNEDEYRYGHAVRKRGYGKYGSR